MVNKDLFLNYDSTADNKYYIDQDLNELISVINYPQHIVDIHKAQNSFPENVDLNFLNFYEINYGYRTDEVIFLDQSITIPDKKVLVLCCVAYDMDDPRDFATFSDSEVDVAPMLTGAIYLPLDVDLLSSYNNLIPDLTFEFGRRIQLENGNLFTLMENDDYILVCYENVSLELFHNLSSEVLKRDIQNAEHVAPEGPVEDADQIPVLKVDSGDSEPTTLPTE